MVPADTDGVPVRDLFGAVLEGVGDDAHGRLGRKDVSSPGGILSVYSSPALWTGKDGKSALVCYAYGGTSLVDPQTGKILCPLPDAGQSPWCFSSPVVSGDTVVVMDRVLTGFRIDYPKAEKIWSVKDFAGGRGTSPVVYQGYAYGFGLSWSD